MLMFLFSIYSQSKEKIKEYDDTVMKFLNKKYPEFKNYFDKTVYFENGEELHKFFEFFRLPILSKNPISGQKMEFNIKKDLEKNNIITVEINLNESKLYFSYTIYKDRVSIIKLSDGWQVNPENWKLMYLIIRNTMIVYPEKDYFDTDLINSLK